jgi:SAM-dependent methyltransferase
MINSSGKGKPVDHFADQVERYDAWFEKNPLLLEAEEKAIRALLPDYEKSIEIGVGTGVFASRLGIREGVEPSAAMGMKAQARGIHVVQASAESLPLPDGAYQLVLMVTADCFLSDVLQAFREINRILSEDGCFAIAFIDRDTPLGQFYERNKHSDEVYKHATFHSASEMAEYLKQAGFKIVSQKQTVFSFDQQPQPVLNGVGEGVFAVMRAEKLRN